MTSLLLGSTGFVGSTLRTQRPFDLAVHRPDVHLAEGRSFDLVVCAAAPAQKWLANQDPDADRANLLRLQQTIDAIECRRFVLVSTVDVYPVPEDVDEASPIDPDLGSPYGRHRLALEAHVRLRHPDALVVRLPGLFGHGLRKNVLFDLLNDNALHLTNGASQFQFYDMRRLWTDVDACLAAGRDLVNFAVAPTQVDDVAARCFGRELPDNPDAPVVRYDVHTRHAELLGGHGHYLVEREEVFGAISAWLAAEQHPGLA